MFTEDINSTAGNSHPENYEFSGLLKFKLKTNKNFKMVANFQTKYTPEI